MVIDSRIFFSHLWNVENHHLQLTLLQPLLCTWAFLVLESYIPIWQIYKIVKWKTFLSILFSSKPDVKVEFQKSCVCLRKKVFEVSAVVAKIKASKVFRSSFPCSVHPSLRRLFIKALKWNCSKLLSCLLSLDIHSVDIHTKPYMISTISTWKKKIQLLVETNFGSGKKNCFLKCHSWLNTTISHFNIQSL